MAVGLRGEWRLVRLKPRKAESEIAEYLGSQRKASRAARLHAEWPRGGAVPGEEGDKREALTEESLSQ